MQAYSKYKPYHSYCLHFSWTGYQCTELELTSHLFANDAVHLASSGRGVKHATPAIKCGPAGMTASTAPSVLLEKNEFLLIGEGGVSINKGAYVHWDYASES